MTNRGPVEMPENKIKQRILVVGAGVIGVTTAYFLAKQGCQVEVIEKNSSSAAFGTSSHQNGGLLCYGAVEPWSSPSTLAKVKKSVTDLHSPLVIRFGSYLFTPQFLNWATLFWKYCTDTEEEYRRRCVGIFNLSYLSAAKMIELREEYPQLRNPNASVGTLSLYRSFQAYQSDFTFMTKFTSNHNLPRPLSLTETLIYGSTLMDGIKPYIPALSMAYGQQIEGGILSAEDSSGDCAYFTRALVDICEDLGVKFHYKEKLEEIIVKDDRVVEIKTDKDSRFADAFVFCPGTSVDPLLKIGVNAPIFPMKGYSLNVPIKFPDLQTYPNVAIVDEEGKRYVSRIGSNMRISGFAELHGYDSELRPDRRDQLVSYLKSILREEDLDFGRAKFYTCHRPVSPDDIPILGQTPRFKNAYVNLGHGSKGWTLAAGSASLLSNLITSQKNEIDPSPFSPNRFPPLSSAFVTSVNFWPFEKR